MKTLNDAQRVEISNINLRNITHELFEGIK